MLKPWREVATPHPDVAEGRYQQAEFAADLAQVVQGTAEPEYQDAREFFARTYMTDGMRQLLTASLERLSGKGGEPVIQLKTAFGGGKTHTMLALFHLLGGKARAEEMAGVGRVMDDAGISSLPCARTAVIAGTALNPSRVREVKGVTVRTLWGDIAAQLGGKAAYAYVEEADRRSVAPGADDLASMFDRFGPAVILMDELVAYMRNIYGVSGLPAGSFDSNMTFVQSLTEAAKRSKCSLVVASIPESNVEIGGEGGFAALERIEKTFGRLEAIWKPVGATEGFEIVRRRLFTPVKDESARDEVCREFSRMYDDLQAEFPQECREGAYLERLRAAYPIHPELFDRLYGDWSSLERFQRTRGVLRLMAAVIHELWLRDDRSLLILPGSIPLDAPRVRNELLRYLSEGWNAIIDKDVDGEHSEPWAIDKANPRFGAILAARRVARTIFLGSAPSVRQQTVRGIEDVRVRLGVAQPGEQISVFNDALNRLVDRLTHLYSGNRRYWYDTLPNLRRTMEDRAGKLDSSEVEAEIVRRLREIRERGEFKGVHTCVPSADIPDEDGARLVILPPSAGYRANRADSLALSAASEILNWRGDIPRKRRNMLLFVAADADQTGVLEQETRRYLAWKSIVDDADALNLDAHQRREASQGKERSDKTLEILVNETYCWLLVPTQEPTQGPGGNWEVGDTKWEATRVPGGQESPVSKVARKVRGAELVAKWSPALLKMEVLDKWLWKDEPHVSVKRVWECLTTYLYMPRLRDEDVLLAAIRDGLQSRDYFGYATSVSADGRYQGLRFGDVSGSVYLDDQSVLVKPEVAAKQLEEDAAVAGRRGIVVSMPPGEAGSSAGGPTSGRSAAPLAGTAVGGAMSEPTIPRRFHGAVNLDPTRVARDAGRIAEEVIQHLTSIVGASVEVTLEIHALVPEGVPDHVVRTVTENCRTLKFTSQGFETE